MQPLSSPRCAAVLAAAVLALAPPARAQERVYLTKTEVEQLLVGKEQRFISSADGRPKRWQVRDGYLHSTDQVTNFRGAARWTVRDDGGFCLKWLVASPDRCFYYFKDGDQYKAVAGLPEESGPHPSARPFEVHIE